MLEKTRTSMGVADGLGVVEDEGSPPTSCTLRRRRAAPPLSCESEADEPLSVVAGANTTAMGRQYWDCRDGPRSTCTEGKRRAHRRALARIIHATQA
jgi:hypothetical protein